MNFHSLYQKSLPHRYALRINRILHPTIRNILRKLLVLVAAGAFALSFGPLPLDFSKADGVFFVAVTLYLCLAFLEFFYSSMRNQGVRTRLKEKSLSPNFVDFALSEILEATDDIDVSRALFESKAGLLVLERAGIERSEAKNFIFGNRSPILSSALQFENENVNLREYLDALYEADKAIQSFLSEHGVQKVEFLGAAQMVENLVEKKRRSERYWSRENLGSIPSIGTSWGYGTSDILRHHSTLFESTVDLAKIDVENGFRAREVEALEEILARSEDANAIIVDDDERIARDIVARLLQRMKLGVSLPSLEHSTIYELDWNGLVATYKDKADLERELINILNEASAAGNVILYMRDLPAFMLNVKASGINIPSILDPYLKSSALHILAHSTNTDFHYFVETSSTLLQGFERIIPDQTPVNSALPALIEKAYELEKDYKIFFSFESILKTAVDADQYVTYGEMPEKAIDLLIEMAPWIRSQKIKIVRADHVAEFVSAKTGVKSGKAEGEEAQKILHLEEILHERVIGQEKAVTAIASAMRKSRSGIVSPKRPIASFLFLGPTGVGKTEVSKALAATYFGSETNMIRLDMSEYNTPEATEKLLGNFASGKSGILASLLRDKPYGVLLLDEFEKSSKEVHDLFLQILDEGKFSDAQGKPVNARNCIIIATSNAGSDKIWQAIKEHKDMDMEKDKIIDSIIAEQIFKPELLNRFDDVILFHPLQNDELASVARLELEKLKQRLKEQNYDLVITHELINFLVEQGSDPKFGARSINRAVKNIVEDAVSKKILSGQVKEGDKIEIGVGELISS